MTGHPFPPSMGPLSHARIPDRHLRPCPTDSRQDRAEPTRASRGCHPHKGIATGRSTDQGLHSAGSRASAAFQSAKRSGGWKVWAWSTAAMENRLSDRWLSTTDGIGNGTSRQRLNTRATSGLRNTLERAPHFRCRPHSGHLLRWTWFLEADVRSAEGGGG